MFLKLITIIFLSWAYYAQAQTICPPVNNAPAVEPCPASYSTYCKNSGYCVILFGAQLSCTCPVGFTGSYCEINQNIIATTTLAPIIITTTASVGLCPAAQQVCLNGGQCLILSANNFVCSCPSLYTGVLCETYLGGVGVTTTAAPVTSCPIGLSNVCQNGGTCLILNNNNVFCSCRIGYTGDLCEIITIATTTQTPVTTNQGVAFCPATIRICQNGGQCLILNGVTVVCSCPTGYSGNYCEIFQLATTTAIMVTNPPVIACPAGTSTVCLNGGQCLLINSVNVFCSCPTGWTGTRCESSVVIITTTQAPLVTTADVAYCPVGINICRNNGICLILNGKDVVCNCLTGFSGNLCEISTAIVTTTTPAPVAACPSGLKICLNGGQCLILNGVEFLCSCINGFTGSVCEISPTIITPSTTTLAPVTLCQAAVNVCQNNGQCVIIDGTTMLCICTPNFTGTNCDQLVKAVDPCTPNPCLNGAFCSVSNANLARCLCTTAFTGSRCEIAL